MGLKSVERLLSFRFFRFMCVKKRVRPKNKNTNTEGTVLRPSFCFIPMQGAMTPGMPLFSPMMPYGSGLTPQPVQNTNSLSILEEQQRQQQAQQQQQQAQQQASSGTPQAVICFIFHIYYEKSWFYLAVVEVNLWLHINNHIFFFPFAGTSGQTPQLFHSQAVGGSTTTALPGNTPLFTTPLTPMTPITPATPASETSGIVPQLQYVSHLIPHTPIFGDNCFKRK